MGSDPPPDFESAVAAAAGVRNVADAGLVDLVVAALAEGWWEGWQIHTPTQWLMWRTGVSRSTARAIVRLAQRADELPTVMAAFRAGRLSLDQATTVARFTPTAYEASVCELAECATVRQIVAATRQYEFDVDAVDRTPSPAKRSVSFGSDGGDGWRASIRLPADEGHVVEAALRCTRDRLHESARTAAKDSSGRTGTDAALGVARVGWADALVGMARSVSASGAAGASEAHRPSLLVHLAAPIDGSDHWRAEDHMGPALPPSLRRYLTCDADVAPVWHADGRAVQVGRSHRIVPRRVRRLVEHRDGGCRVPGCDSTLWVEVHHIVHWEDDGDTVTGNLICLCSRHHRQHHQGLLDITGDADRPGGVTFTTGLGRVLEPSGLATPPGSMPRVPPYRGPTGERLPRDCITFTRRREPVAARRQAPGACSGESTRAS